MNHYSLAFIYVLEVLLFEVLKSVSSILILKEKTLIFDNQTIIYNVK